MTLPHALVTVDIAVVGAGPAGIAAATRAAECGKRVIMLDENPGMGGQIWRPDTSGTRSGSATRWIARFSQSGASRWQGASVVDASRPPGGAGFELTVEGSMPAMTVRATTIVLATGARERFLPFPGWTLPGVIGVGAAQAMMKAGTSFERARVVIAGSGPLMLPVAASLAAHGARLLFVAEQADRAHISRFAAGLWRSPGTLLQAANYRRRFVGIPYRFGWWVSAAHGAGKVEEVVLTNGVKSRTIACDVLSAAYGLVPNTELARLLGCELAGSAVRVDEHQQTTVPSVFSAGECTGIGGVDLSLAEGEIAGYAAAASRHSAKRAQRRRTRLQVNALRLETAFALRDELRRLATPDTILCRCEDVTAGAIDPQWGMRRTKLYTRAGMGACQGRVCGTALEFMHGWTADRVRLPSETALVSTLIAHDMSSAIHEPGV